MKRLFCYLIAVIALVSCSSDIGPVGHDMDASLEGKPVTITFAVPNVCMTPSTKTLDDGDGLIADDPYLDPTRLYVVACGYSQSIKYIRKAEQVLDENTHQPVISTALASEIPGYPLTDATGSEIITLYHFQVQLDLSDSERTIHFLGNIDENQLITGSYSYQVLPSLLSYEGKQAYWQMVSVDKIHPLLDGNNQPVIKNGSYLPDASTAAYFQYVPLIRNYAKIQVTDATDPADGFELFSYAVIYYPKRGSVVPYRYNASDYHEAFNFNTPENYRFSGYEKCNFTTLDETLDYRGNMPAGIAFDHDIPDASLFEHPENSGGRVIRYDKTKPDQGFYVFERGVPTTTMDPTYVIIRGRFGNSDYYYYRLDLMETKMVNYESIYQYYPIYRNFKYNIQLNRISSQGVSTPEAAANSSGAEDISADISMRHLGDISNGISRLVVEPYMSRTNPIANDDGYCYLYARFFDDVNSADPNMDWGAVTVELEHMEDNSDDILVVYDDQEHEVHGGGFFYPEAQTVGGVPGFRVIRFKTKNNVLDETKTQKIKITGRNQYSYEQYPLYREVEITLQNKQTMTVSCNPEVSLQPGSSQVLNITIPAGLPTSMFPLSFTIEAEAKSLTPDNNIAGNNLPVVSGLSISDNPEYAGRQTFQFVRTLTLDEYNDLPVNEGQCTFSCYFKTNRSVSATTIWVYNEYFYKGVASFQNPTVPTNQFYIQAVDEKCFVRIVQSDLEYKLDDENWQPYTSGSSIPIERDHKVSFKSTKTIKAWNGSKFYCYRNGSSNTSRNGKFKVGGNIASLIVGDNYETQGSGQTGFSFLDFFKGHTGLTDASELLLPMTTLSNSCYKSMFDGCTSLKKAPAILPATTLANTCYRNMFYGCSSLVEAPELPAETITNDCYQRMFYGCSSLKLIKMNSKEYKSGAFYSREDDVDYWWAGGVAAEGEIWLNPAIKDKDGYWNMIPAGWTVKSLPDGTAW